MAQEIKDLFKKASEYDSKHIKNLSTKKVPQQLLDAVENGCSIETLQKLAGKQFPICKYATQITVHGIFDDLKTRRVGGMYVNLTKNKNQSLGIRWTAIDHDKKAELFHNIRLVDSEWHVMEDSQAFYLRKMKRITKENYTEVLAAFKQKAESIDTSLFTGYSSAYVMQGMWGDLNAVLTVNVQCFPLQNMQKITENITEQDATTIKALQEAELARRKAEHERKEQERREREAREEQERKEREKAQKERQERFAEWQRKNGLPRGFKTVTDHVYKPGNIEIYNAREVEPGKFEYLYQVYYKSFGKLCVAHCDQTGKKIAKGTEVWLKQRKETRIKEA